MLSKSVDKLKRYEWFCIVYVPSHNGSNAETGTELITTECTHSPVNIWYYLKQIATEFFSAGMHSGEVSLKHTKNPLRHLWGKQVKSPIKVTFSH